MRRVWKPALLLAGLLGAGLLLRSGLGTEALSAPARLGVVPFLLVASAACAVGVPRQVVAYAAGLGWGVWQGSALALAAEMAGCVVDFAWARLVARGWVAARLRGRLARLDGALARHPFTITLTLRLLPLGSNVALNLLAGASAVRVWPFLAASAVGYVPQTVVFTLLGSGVGVGRDTQIALGIALFAAATGLGLVLLRRNRRLGDAAEG